MKCLSFFCLLMLVTVFSARADVAPRSEFSIWCDQNADKCNTIKQKCLKRASKCEEFKQRALAQMTKTELRCLKHPEKCDESRAILAKHKKWCKENKKECKLLINNRKIERRQCLEKPKTCLMDVGIESFAEENELANELKTTKE